MKSISMRVEGKTAEEFITAFKHNYRLGKIHSVKNDNKNFKVEEGKVNIFPSNNFVRDLDFEKEFKLTRNKLDVKIKMKNIDAKNFTMTELNLLRNQCEYILEKELIMFFIKQKKMYELQKKEYIKNKNIKDSKIEDIKNSDRYIQLLNIGQNNKLAEEYLKEEIKKLNISLKYPRWERLTAPIFEGLVAFGNVYDLDSPKEERQKLTKEFNNLMIGEDQKPSELMKKINSQVLKNIEKLEQELNIDIRKDSITWHLDEDGLIHAHYLGNNYNKETGQPIATPKKSEKATNKNTVSKQVGELIQDIIADNMEELGFERGVKGGKLGRTTNISILEYKQECNRLDALRENTEKDIMDEIVSKQYELKNLKEDIEFQESQKVDIKTLQRTRDNYDSLLKETQELEEKRIELNTFLLNNSKKEQELKRLDTLNALNSQKDLSLKQSIAEHKKELETLNNDLDTNIQNKENTVITLQNSITQLEKDKAKREIDFEKNNKEYEDLKENVYYYQDQLRAKEQELSNNNQLEIMLEKVLDDGIVDISEVEELISETKEDKQINKFFKLMKKMLIKNKSMNEQISRNKITERALEKQLEYIDNTVIDILKKFPQVEEYISELVEELQNMENEEHIFASDSYKIKFNILEKIFKVIIDRKLLNEELMQKILDSHRKSTDKEFGV